MPYFPMYINIQGALCLVAGGGEIAQRKVMVLRDFGASVVVVAQEIRDAIAAISGVTCVCREFKQEDISGMCLVVAATDDPVLNHRISRLCRQQGIPVNVVDQPEDCDFIFPSYICKGEVVASFSSGGQSPVVTQYLKRQNEPVVSEFLGELAAFLGSLRHDVGQRIPDTELRRELYRKLLYTGLEQGKIPQGDEAETLIKEMEQYGSYETSEDE